MLGSVAMRWLIAMMLIAVAACASPDSKTGTDGKRHLASVVPLDEWTIDEDGVNYSAGDRTDWKQFDVPRSGPIVAELLIDRPSANINVALYNSRGKLIKEGSNRLSKDRAELRLEAEAPEGTCFLQIFARGSGDQSGYSTRITLGGPGGEYIPPPE